MSAPRARVVRRPVHGVLLIDKPRGLSSNQALQKAKWLLRAEKAGHTGTLDPLATGLLPVCFGAATKFSQLQLDADKTYEAQAVLGVRTTTGDAEGEILHADEPGEVGIPTPEAIAEVQRRFTGALQQVPPMHSALKRDGKALYEYARAGQEVTRTPRAVFIHALRITPGMPTAQGYPTLHIVATVSKGTYIRTLGEDIGASLGPGAHLAALRRLSTGELDVAHAVTLEALEAQPEPERLARLLPPQVLLAGHAPITLAPDDAGRFLSGVRRRGPWADADAVAVFGREPAALLGTGHVKAGELIPGRLLSPLEIQHILASTASHEVPTP